MEAYAAFNATTVTGVATKSCAHGHVWDRTGTGECFPTWCGSEVKAAKIIVADCHNVLNQLIITSMRSMRLMSNTDDDVLQTRSSATIVLRDWVAWHE